MALIMGIFGIYLLFGGLYVTLGMNVEIPNKEYKVARGDNVTVPCTFKVPAADLSVIVTWSTLDLDAPDDPSKTILTYFNPSKVTVTKAYKGRASLVHDIPKGFANLQLSRVTSADTRNYECKVQVEAEEDGSLSDTAKVIVLVAPSPPDCKVVGVAEFGQNINLTCFSHEGTPKPIYKWQSHNVNNIPRPNPPKATDQNGVLSLYNVSQDTSGFYICTSTNEIRSAKCNLTLAVMPPSMNIASTAGIIGGIVAVIVLLGIIVFCCRRCRRKEKAEEYAMGSPEGGEFTDKEPEGKAEDHEEHVSYEEERRVKSAVKPQDPRDDRSERSYGRRSDYDDRKDEYSYRQDDRRERYDRDDHYDDRRDRYDDRRDRSNDHYDDRRDRSDDRYDDRRDRSDDRYADRQDHNDDRNSERYSDRYDSRDRPPSIPLNKPKVPRS
ncbi:glycoprotein A33 (transmembrane), paralog a [Xyrauchen texanus]|uniref:glycoprotein A33 (transmembrane), paralog a n=1 Tax=Xyrauchen texanus TaxID=154827 RepID=UPI002241DE6D|nr:glycoprotein A33 (transmembrane), paralog a [Xyrauchen texanus]